MLGRHRFQIALSTQTRSRSSIRHARRGVFLTVFPTRHLPRTNKSPRLALFQVSSPPPRVSFYLGPSCGAEMFSCFPPWSLCLNTAKWTKQALFICFIFVLYFYFRQNLHEWFRTGVLLVVLCILTLGQIRSCSGPCDWRSHDSSRHAERFPSSHFTSSMTNYLHKSQRWPLWTSLHKRKLWRVQYEPVSTPYWIGYRRDATIITAAARARQDPRQCGPLSTKTFHPWWLNVARPRCWGSCRCVMRTD